MINNTTNAPDDMAALAVEMTGQAVGALTQSKVSQETLDAAYDFQADVAEILARTETLKTQLVDLETKRDYVPEAGYRKLRRAAIESARRDAKDLEQRAKDDLVMLRTALETDAVPKLSPERELQARDELKLVAGNLQGDALVARLVDFAQDGAREPLAVLLSTSYGATLMGSRGLSRADQQQALAEIRRTVALGAAEFGATDRERDAGSLSNVPNEVAAATTAAMTVVAETTGGTGHDAVYGS